MTRSHDDKLATYKALIDGVPDLTCKGAKSNYTSMNGNMFSFLSTEGVLAFRLGKDRHKAFLEADPDAVVLQHGRVMKHYVRVSDAVRDDSMALKTLWEHCVADARQLTPKATTRKKKKPA